MLSIAADVIFFSGEHKVFLKFIQKNNKFVILFIILKFLTQFMKGRLTNIRMETCPSQYRNTINLE